MSNPQDCKASCAVTAPPPNLNHVKVEERKTYRQRAIQEWLSQFLERAPKECFGHYIGRVHAVASRELSFEAPKKSTVGDEFPHALDKFVWRILQGGRLVMLKHGVTIDQRVEMENLAMLREECEELFNDMQIYPDPRLKMLPGDTWSHSAPHCSSSRAGRDCSRREGDDADDAHRDGHHDSRCVGAAGMQWPQFSSR